MCRVKELPLKFFLSKFMSGQSSPRIENLPTLYKCIQWLHDVHITILHIIIKIQLLMKNFIITKQSQIL